MLALQTEIAVHNAQHVSLSDEALTVELEDGGTLTQFRLAWGTEEAPQSLACCSTAGRGSCPHHLTPSSPGPCQGFS